MRYSALIVDDEEPARNKIEQFLNQMKPIFKCSSVADGKEALEVIQHQRFDLIFLDIQMPEMGAFEMLRQVQTPDLPPIIFSTAYDQYALQAFEVHAVDYLLKPYDFDRFHTAVQRILALIDSQKYSDESLRQMLTEWKAPVETLDVIWVAQGSKLIPIQIIDIEYLESDGNYVQLHSKGHKYLLRRTLAELQSKLNGQGFVRVHRSYVVNQSFIREVQPKSHGDLFAVLKNGSKLPVSRRYRDHLLK